MRRRDPEQDWLPHCLQCDGRHDDRRMTCAQFKEMRKQMEECYARGDFEGAWQVRKRFEAGDRTAAEDMTRVSPAIRPTTAVTLPMEG